MTRIFAAVTTLACTLVFASGVMACDKKCGKKAAAPTTSAKATAATTKATTASAKVASAKVVTDGATGANIVDAGVARYMKQLPQMAYKVGDVETPCGYTAKSKAKATGQEVTYLVGGGSFASEKAAMNKLATLIEGELANSGSVATSVNGECYPCPMTAAAVAAEKKTEVMYMVAGIEFGSKDKASTVADQLASKMKEYGLVASGSGDGSKTAKVASGSAPCAKSAAKAGGCGKAKGAKTASATKGGCGSAKTASGKGDAASKLGCCSKDKAKDAVKNTAKVAAVKTPSAEIASAKAASAEPAGTSAPKLGCCSKKKKAAEPAAMAHTAMKAGGETASADTPELARAKQMVREIVEFVATAKNS